MIKFWLIAIFIFIISTYILSKLTLKSNRAETGEQFDLEMEGLFIGVFLLLCSFGITVVIMLILHWIEFLFLKNLKYFK
jgi:hypothetical protein